MKDIRGNEIKVGDTVAVASTQYSSAHLRMGKVLKINPRSISIRINDPTRTKWKGNEYVPDPDYNTTCNDPATKCVIIDQQASAFSFSSTYVPDPPSALAFPAQPPLCPRSFAQRPAQTEAMVATIKRDIGR